MTSSCPPLQLTYLPQPWGNCRAESGLREPELQGYSAYSVSACRLRCEKEAVLQRCHCRMVHMPGGHPSPTSPPCCPARLQNLQGSEHCSRARAGARVQHVCLSVPTECTCDCWGCMPVFTCTYGTHKCMLICIYAYMCSRMLYLWTYGGCVQVCICLHAYTRVYNFMLICMSIYTLMSAHVCANIHTLGMCVHAPVCTYVGMWWGRGDGTVDSRNNLLSFQATRPSAHQTSTSNVLTTPWVRAAFFLLCLSITLLFISPSTFLLTASACLLPVSPWGEGFFLGVEPYPIPPGV